LGKKRKYEVTCKEASEWANNYERVRVWLSRLQEKAQNAWNLWLFCKTVGKDPNELLALKDDPKSRDAEYLLDNFVADEQLTNSIKVKVAISVKSFYKHNYRDLAKASGQISFIKKGPYRRHSKEELLRIYRATQNPRDRALITFTWSTGIARGSLQKIQWKHLEPNWEKQELPHIGLPDKLIKGHGVGRYRGVEQHTFLTPEAKQDLVDYKDWLEKKRAVNVTPEDYIFVQTCKPYRPLVWGTFSQIASELSLRSGVKFSWHDGRRYVETALEETKINPNWARKIRGRKVRGEEAPYSRPAVEQLRAAYKEAVPLLEFTQPTTLMAMQRRQEVLERLQAKWMSGEPLSPEERAEAEHHHIRLFKRAPKRTRTETNGGDCGEQYLQIPEDQLLEHLRAGWTIVKELKSGEVIVRR